jgi:hypothetical protein
LTDPIVPSICAKARIRGCEEEAPAPGARRKAGPGSGMSASLSRQGGGVSRRLAWDRGAIAEARLTVIGRSPQPTSIAKRRLSALLILSIKDAGQ